jgi:hypothetical protein
VNPYARGTHVSVSRSKAELEEILVKHGAGRNGILNDADRGRAIVMFTLSGRDYRVVVPLPFPSDFATKYVRGKAVEVKGEARVKAWEQACRERWRAVVLVVRAKLELVALGASTIEREFLADLLLPSGARVHEELAAPVAEAYRTQKPLLLGPGGGR